MSVNDPLGDLLSRIRNAQQRKKSKVSTPGSRLRANVLEVLKTEGYIRGYTSVEHKDGRSEFEIELKYFDGAPVIREIERVSKPGRRVYASVKALPRVNNGLGVAILSTPKGVMADHDARDNNVGGEILCTVFSYETREPESRCNPRPAHDRRAIVLAAPQRTSSHVSCRKKTCCHSLRRHRQRGRPGRQGKGPQG